jgi:hypothetical protein
VPGLASALPAPSAFAGRASLACAIPNLYGPYGLVLPIPDGRTAHFNSSFQSNFMALNTAIAAQLTLLPLASPASVSLISTIRQAAFTHGPRRASGRCSLSARRNHWPTQIVFRRHFSALPIQQARWCGPASFSGCIRSPDHHPDRRLAETIYLDSEFDRSQDNQFTVFGTYGLTNKIDLSVDIPFVQVGYNVSSEGTINRIVNTGPIFTPGPNSVNVECCASSGGAGPYGPNWGYSFDPNNSKAVSSADLRTGNLRRIS